ncbi:hypothetical protein ILUMI_20071, partial [Ignelater luminosus]
TKSYLKGDSCEKHFHKCILRTRQIHIPTEDENTFLCHNCYEELDDNGSTNDNYEYELCESTEENAEEPGIANHSTEELGTRSDTGKSDDDQDTYQLYEFYMSESKKLY